MVGSADATGGDGDADVARARWRRLDVDEGQWRVGGRNMHGFVERHVLTLTSESPFRPVQRPTVSWGVMTSTTLALMPDFLDPIKLIGYFGTWALVGLLVVIFVESGLLFPVLPGDTLLFVAGMLAAGTAAAGRADFQLWQLLVFIPIAAVLGGQVGYFIGRYVGTAMFKPNARVLKQRYLDEAHTFFEERGPFAIVLARFVPIVRTLAPITAGAARMSYGTFTLFNVIGAVLWGVGITLLGYGLGQFEVIQKLLEPIFILIAVASITPMLIEWYKRRRAAKKATEA
jgi:membrane-associated protein